MRLLLAEDERDLNRILTNRLTREGYSVDACYDGEEALLLLQEDVFDGAILDVMMPKLDGFTVLEKARAAGVTTPVLFLTARDDVEDRVRGLDAGADDYLVKPFAIQELLARIRVLVRAPRAAATSLLRAADLVMDEAAHTVRRGEREINLSAKEYALLKYLLHNKNRVLSRETLEDHVWNYDYEGGSNVVDVYISYLRKRIDGEEKVKLIHTMRGAGYLLKDE